MLAALGGLAISLCSGGSARQLGRLEPNRWWLLLAAGAAQAAGRAGVIGQGTGLGLAAACTGGFLLSNRTLRGLGLLATGLAANCVAVAANGGVMPVSLTALARSNQGNAALPAGPLNAAASPGTTLRPLTDVIAVPLPFGSRPFGSGEVLSVGDVLVAAGVGLVLFSATRGHRRQGDVPGWADGEEGPEAARA